MSFNYIYIIIGLLVLFLFRYLISLQNRVSWKKSESVLDTYELNFFNSLSQSISPQMYICPKVRIADLINVDYLKGTSKYQANFNKISQKHVDFVICDKQTFNTKLVIELDGASHNKPSRIDRDNFIDQVFETAGIPILHIPVSNSYKIDELSSQITQLIENR